MVLFFFDFAKLLERNKPFINTCGTEKKFLVFIFKFEKLAFIAKD